MNRIRYALLFLLFGGKLMAQKIIDQNQFGHYNVTSYSNRVVKLYKNDQLLLTVPFSESTTTFPAVFMEDVDFDGDLDLFISNTCGSNCDYKVYTNYKGKFALNAELTEIAFLSDYFFDKANNYFYFIEHASAVTRNIKFYKWNGPKLIFFKEVYEDTSKDDGYYETTSKERKEGRWVTNTTQTKIPTE